MVPRSFSLPMTSRSRTPRASAVSVDLLNSNSSVDAMLTMAGFLGASGAGLATGAGAGAGVAAGAGAGVGAGAGAGAGASWVAQPKKAATDAAASSALKFIFVPLLCLTNALHLSMAAPRETTLFVGSRQAFFRGKTVACMIKFRLTFDGKFRQRNAAHQPRRGDAALVSRLRHERDRGQGPARRARWPQAGPPPRAFRDA